MKTTRGFSIVEVLVALVVLSIGMLGIAALYVESLRAGRTAVYRTQAVNLASDLADRIRANRQARQAYQLDAGTDPGTANDCQPTAGNASVNCSQDDLAQDDLVRWVSAIQEQLPGNGQSGDNALPRGTVNVADLDDGTFRYTIQISWAEIGQDEDTPLTYVLELQI